MTMLSAMLLAAAAQAAEPAPAAPPAPLPASGAIALFQTMCVATMPDPRGFANALGAGTTAWTPYENARREAGIPGNYWQAAQGQLGYLYRRNPDGSGPYPSCEFAFLTQPGFRLDDTATALSSALGLGTGRREGQTTHWETRLQNGTEVRIALAPFEGMVGPAARLTAFAFRLPPGFE